MAAPSFGQLHAECSLSGTAGDCSRFVANFCNGLTPISISPFNSAAKCYNTPGNAFKCDFTVLNTINATGTPSVAHCDTTLNTVTSSCSMGGQGIFAGGAFMFAVDPNNGTCGLPCGD
ncbi:hypothetical protein C8J57DRAFT_183991 [Mycena rebaudengoi]|nr:hypothetical protein C8J57DRAFT_183991 [Mycena rebaudengoi]